MPQSFVMAPPSRELIEHFNLMPKAAISEWLELKRALSDSGARVVIAQSEADTGRHGLLWKKALPGWDAVISSGEALKLAVPVSYEQVVYDKNKKILWYGFTNGEEFSRKKQLDELFEEADITVRAIPIEKKEQFPTLSHCMNVLPNGTLLWARGCFGEHAQDVLELFYPRNVQVEDEDAVNFVCGFIAVGSTVIAPQMSTRLKQKLSMPNSILEIDARQWTLRCLTLKSIANEIME